VLQANVFADCPADEVTFKAASNEQKREILDALKDTLIDTCSLRVRRTGTVPSASSHLLQGCRYVTENLENIKTTNGKKGARFRLLTRWRRVRVTVCSLL
jgi:DNA-binding transcriptional ArsR family regulator